MDVGIKIKSFKIYRNLDNYLVELFFEDGEGNISPCFIFFKKMGDWLYLWRVEMWTPDGRPIGILERKTR